MESRCGWNSLCVNASTVQICINLRQLQLKSASLKWTQPHFRASRSSALKKCLRMCFWMQGFGKLWSVPPSFPRGSLLTDQHKSSPSDSSAGHNSAGFSWRGLLSPVVCISCGLEDRLWNLQDCHFSSLLSWYSSSNKHFFSHSLCNLSTVQLF